MNKKNTIKRDIKKTESITMNKTTTVKKQTRKKSTKKEKNYYRIDEFSLNDGDILVYRTNRSGEFWTMSIWISGEKRYFIKSLRTKDKEKAIKEAKRIYLWVFNLVKSKNSQNIFSGSKDFIRSQSGTSSEQLKVIDICTKYKSANSECSFSGCSLRYFTIIFCTCPKVICGGKHNFGSKRYLP
jgi:hypothetical protein